VNFGSFEEQLGHFSALRIFENSPGIRTAFIKNPDFYGKVVLIPGASHAVRKISANQSDHATSHEAF
jgi:hypothetical protein